MLHISITREAQWHYLGPLVFEGPAGSTITSYNCRPFCVTALVEHRGIEKQTWSTA